jgi:hypothetical protein
MARPARSQQAGASPAAARCGPYQTEREAAGAAGAMHAAAPGIPLAAGNHQMLTQACAAARVQLGDFDRRILTWLAGWEPATCAVVAGLIRRAAAAPPSPPRAAGRKKVPDGPGHAR